MIKVLFVCTGNICRSPTAEGVFRHLTDKAGLKDAFHIDSAGTYSGHIGEPPDARAIRTAKKNGVSLEGQKARALKAADFSDFEYIYAMDGGHLDEMLQRAPKSPRARIAMFMDDDVPDPWYGNERDFEHAYALILSGAGAILDTLRETHDL
jgi:protein-tyrosine phosphatase